MAGPTAPTEVPRRAVRGGYAKGDARRELIIEVATEIFGTQGFRAATMLQIAAACGISRTGLLHHFPTKESLLEAVLAHRDTGGQETGRHEVGGTPATPDGEDLAQGPTAGRARLRQLLDVVEHNATQPRIVNLFSVLSAEAGDPTHPAHGYFEQRYARLRAELGQACTVLAQTDQLAPGTDPEALAIELIALMDGLQVQWVLAPNELDMAAVLRHRLSAALAVPLD